MKNKKFKTPKMWGFVSKMFEAEKCRLCDDKITDYLGNLCENCKNLLYEGLGGYELIELRDNNHITKDEFIQARMLSIARNDKLEKKHINRVLKHNGIKRIGKKKESILQKQY